MGAGATEIVSALPSPVPRAPASVGPVVLVQLRVIVRVAVLDGDAAGQDGGHVVAHGLALGFLLLQFLHLLQLDSWIHGTQLRMTPLGLLLQPHRTDREGYPAAVLPTDTLRKSLRNLRGEAWETEFHEQEKRNVQSHKVLYSDALKCKKVSYNFSAHSTVKENSRTAQPDLAATGHERLFQGRFTVAGGPHSGPCSWTAWNPKAWETEPSSWLGGRSK